MSAHHPVTMLCPSTGKRDPVHTQSSPAFRLKLQQFV